MSACTFLAADVPLPTRAPTREYPLEINLDCGTVYDGGANDNFFLLPFGETGKYTAREHGVYLEWYVTAGRAEQVVQYIADALRETDAVELWRVWLGEFYEYEESPVIRRQVISAEELRAEDVLEVAGAEIWNRPDRHHPDRPSFYRLTVKK